MLQIPSRTGGSEFQAWLCSSAHYSTLKERSFFRRAVVRSPL